MAKTIGGNLNTNSEATTANGITLNATTSTLILAANADRIFVHINSDDSNNECWIKLQPAATDNDKKGIFFSKRTDIGPGIMQFTLDGVTVYTGEISAIADTGSPIVFVTEF